MNTRIYFSIIYFGFLTLVGNAQLVANFTVSPSTFSCGQSVQFDANSSTVSSGHNIVKYEWDFDYDGVTFDIQASGVVVEHSYSSMKTYTVALRVTDDSDPSETDIGTENATLSFTNHAPVADAGDTYYTARVNDVPASVIINAKDSYDPDSPCDEVVAYKWDTDSDGLFGSDDTDGGLCNGSECEGETITILDNNWYPGSSASIYLQVIDSYGLVSSTASTVVQVRSLDEVPPAINDIKIDEVVSGDAFIELKVSHPEEAPQTFNCSFYLMPDDIELSVYDIDDNLKTQIDYAGNNVNQSVIRYFDTTPFSDRINGYLIKVVVTMSDDRQSEKVTRPFSIDNTPPVNPESCSDFGTTSGNCTNDNDPYFVWPEGSDNYSDVLKYYYYWGTDPYGESETNIATYNGYDPDPLMSDGMYYLRVNTVDEAENSSGWATLYTYKFFDYKHSDVMSICDGDSLLWHEDYYKTAGTYYDNLVALNGCDSICELTFSVNPIPESFVITGQTSVVKDQTEIYVVPENSDVTYTWDVMNGTITNQISNRTAEIQWGDAMTGYIYVVAENTYGCPGDTSILEVNIGTTDIDVLSGNSNIEIYPNPVNDILSVHYDKDFILELYDINGSIMLISSDKEINVLNIKQGMYIGFIRNKHGQLIKIFKIVKK